MKEEASELIQNDFTPAQLTGYEIIERFRSEELRDKPIFDCVPRIVGMLQMPDLESWADFFRKKGVPFIIARKQGFGTQVYSLWKERYAF